MIYDLVVISEKFHKSDNPAVQGSRAGLVRGAIFGRPGFG